ncbi:uroporphyrinogen decarboxylase [Rubellicoccus peritrichatus]|uniref:Uroporphyrinogen decarboxylase n=1 Tax=Rubellicoccus peritrichatus TaxID=3080537 RepID=A0AAQ3LI46_9BACT|nr:uroporphyrinogen decarboxylase [Puniceicoccus sp. CR14]WOO42499.1 uroporphyrinogen decarboxylase [Puniceicoccus sp. CR14]
MTSRQRFLAAANCQATDRPPIWVMRQAGRYLPEYRELKTKHSFLEMVRTPELATEVTLQPLKRFALDAAIIFSDILIIPEALGQPYHFRDQGGIGMDFALNEPRHFENLRDSSAIRENLNYVADALKLTRKEISKDKALLGFAGSPWTLACYMVEGGSSDSFSSIKTLALDEPALFGRLMETLAESVAELLKMKIEAGADAVQIFDSWGAACPGNRYWDWSLRWIESVIQKLPAETPVIIFAKGMALHAKTLAATGASILSLDWTAKINEVHDSLGGKVAVQGNLDPVLMTTSPPLVEEAAKEILESMRGKSGHIFNLGHGITPNAKIECMQTLVETVTSWK